MQITENIYVLDFSRGSLIYILKNPDGLTVIDTGSEPEGARLVFDFVRNSPQCGPITSIFLTHWHGDHAGGAEELRRITGARLICHQQDALLLSGQVPIDYCWKKPMPRQGLGPIMRGACSLGYRFMRANTESVNPDEVVVEGPAPFAKGWQVLELPGHTPGSCGLWSKERGILFTGDTVINAGRRLMPPPPFLVQDDKALYNSWQKLNDIGVIEWILPGHFRPLRWGRRLEIPKGVGQRGR